MPTPLPVPKPEAPWPGGIRVAVCMPYGSTREASPQAALEAAHLALRHLVETGLGEYLD